MFTPGKIVFAISFLIAFIFFMIWSYRKDAANHKNHYQGSAKKLAFYASIVIFLFVVIRFFTRL